MDNKVDLEVATTPTTFKLSTDQFIDESDFYCKTAQQDFINYPSSSYNTNESCSSPPKKIIKIKECDSSSSCDSYSFGSRSSRDISPSCSPPNYTLDLTLNNRKRQIYNEKPSIINMPTCPEIHLQYADNEYISKIAKFEYLPSEINKESIEGLGLVDNKSLLQRLAQLKENNTDGCNPQCKTSCTDGFASITTIYTEYIEVPTCKKCQIQQ